MVCVKVQIVCWQLFSYHNRLITDWFTVRLQVCNIMLVPAAIPCHAELLWNTGLGIQSCNVLHIYIYTSATAWLPCRGCFSVWIGNAVVELAVPTWGLAPNLELDPLVLLRRGILVLDGCPRMSSRHAGTCSYETRTSTLQMSACLGLL